MKTTSDPVSFRPSKIRRQAMQIYQDKMGLKRTQVINDALTDFEPIRKIERKLIDKKLKQEENQHARKERSLGVSDRQ
ncbi:hypothetical protein JGU72_04715 [Antrihabitans sp. YC2-6]|nr:hypothetical protein [Antrihabitans sp. YC2-6]